MQQKKKYSARTAKSIVDNAIVYGMPVSKVVVMYERARETIKHPGKPGDRQADQVYYAALNSMFLGGLIKYSSMLSFNDGIRNRKFLLPQREKLIASLTKNEPDKQHSEQDETGELQEQQ